MATPLRALIVEDSDDAALLILRQLRRAGYALSCERVDTLAVMETALARQSWDLILCDWNLPHFDGMEALNLLRNSGLDIPFILVAGPIGERVAVAAVKAGAHDYVRKDDLARLGPVLERELVEAASRRARRETECALRKSEEQFRALFELAAVGMAQVDLSTQRFLRVNVRFREITGYAADELLRLTVPQLIHPEDREADGTHFGRMEPGESPECQAEKRYVRRDGQVIWVQVNAVPIRDPGGRPASAILVIQEVTARRQAEEELRRSEALKSGILLAALDAIVTMDHQGKVVEWNPAAERTFGHARAEAVGQEMASLIIPERLREAHRNGLSHYLATEEGPVLQKLLELPAVRADGTEFPVEIYITPIPMAGEPLFTGFVRDITERKQAEEALRESEERFRISIEASPTAVVMVDQPGTIALCNGEAERLFGYAREELLGRPVEILVPERFRAQHPGLRAAFIGEPQARRMGAGRELYARRKDGSELPVEIALSPELVAGDGAFVLAAITNISERKRAEAALRESEANFRGYFENVAIGTAQIDPAGHFLRVNDRFCAITGYPREKLVGGMGPLDLDHPEDREADRERITRFLRGEVPLYDTEKRYVRNDGRVVWVHVSASPVRDAAGRLRFTAGVIEDITERTMAEAELEQARQRVLQAEIEKKRFNREVIRAVTRDKFHLAEAEEIPIEGELRLELPLARSGRYARLRRELRCIGESQGMCRHVVEDLVLAVGEAATNAVKHATEGQAAIYLDGKRVTVRVSDQGSGIRPEDLPATLFRAGYSTKVSLGMGYTLMLELADTIWLATGPAGTVVQIEKWLHPEEHQEEPLLALLERF